MKSCKFCDLDDCKYCPHQRIQHADKDGVCMVGMTINNPCYCIGFTEKEIVEIGA